MNTDGTMMHVQHTRHVLENHTTFVPTVQPASQDLSHGKFTTLTTQEQNYAILINFSLINYKNIFHKIPSIPG